MIAVDRGDRDAAAIFEVVCEEGRAVVIPAGVLCGATGTADVIDASVALAARRHRGTVVSSDRSDIEVLDPRVPVVDC
ncbi:MAG: hypothetical protein ACYDEP_02900 [Acidimicrobiales bacterium]